VRSPRQPAEEPLEILDETARRLVDEIRESYRRIRKLL